jgi:hypothetical protein
MFDKVVVIDARGHLLGRLLPMLQNNFLVVFYLLQVKELLLLDAKESTLQVLSSEIKLNSLNF